MMISMRKRKRFLRSLAIVLGSALLVAALEKPLQNASWVFFDLWQNVFPAEDPPGVAVILLDQPSLDLMDREQGYVYPWPREFHGALMLAAKHFQARAVGFDMIFSESSHHGVEDDKLFAERIRESGVPAFFPAEDSIGSVKPPVKEIAAAAAGLGAVHIPRESDKNIRRASSFLEGKNREKIPTLAEVIYQKVYGKPSGLDDHSMVRFYTEQSVIKFSFYHIMQAVHAIENGEPLSDFYEPLKDKIWIVGASAPGLMDFKPPPLGPRTPGMYLHAMSLANRIQGQTIRSVPSWVQWPLLIVLLAASALVIFTVNTPTMAVALVSLAAVIDSFLISAVFWQFSYWLNPLVLLTGSILAGAGIFSLRFQSEWKERRQLAESIKNSMSDKMVQLIREGKVEVSRFGERKTVTILFSDLSGFTTLSEKLSPDVLVKILNNYFDHVVDLIFQNNGYVDKFIGDAVMALWGAPVADENHLADVENALKTARDFHLAVEKANLFAREHWAGANLQARVGLHVGQVIAGNIGSEKRHNYTAIGDAVNLAARLESLGKYYERWTLVSQDVVRELSARGETPRDLLEVDTVQVKGKSEPTTIYTFIGEAERAQAKAYGEALALYRQARWQEAAETWKSCPEISCADVMRNRCEKALLEGTPAKWKDGVWVLDEK